MSTLRAAVHIKSIEKCNIPDSACPVPVGHFYGLRQSQRFYIEDRTWNKQYTMKEYEWRREEILVQVRNVNR